MIQGEKLDNARAGEIADTEGLGYAVTDYISGDKFEDPVTARLWNEAGDALDRLERHLQDEGVLE